MKQREMARLDALQRVQAFFSIDAPELARVRASASKAELDQTIAVLRGLAADQSAAVVESTSRTRLKDELRERLRQEYLRPIAAIRAENVYRTPELPEFRLPPKNLSDGEFVAMATAMGDAAERHPALLAREGLPADFVAQLRAALAALSSAMVGRSMAAVGRTGATVGIRVELSRARVLVNVLDALMQQQVRGRPELLEAWNDAKRVKAKRGRTKGN